VKRLLLDFSVICLMSPSIVNVSNAADPNFSFASTVAKDNNTGLIWTRNANTPGPNICIPNTDKYLLAFSWEEDGIEHYINCLNTNLYLGFDNWRLATASEYSVIANYGNGTHYEYLNSIGFINVLARAYWSSTRNYFEYAVDMATGKTILFYSPDFYNTGGPVWPVRTVVGCAPGSWCAP